MSLKRYRLRAKHLKRKIILQSEWGLPTNIRYFVSSKRMQRKAKRMGGYPVLVSNQSRSRIIYIAPTDTNVRFIYRPPTDVALGYTMNPVPMFDDAWIINLRNGDELK
jgi:hypothetical protein